MICITKVKYFFLNGTNFSYNSRTINVLFIYVSKLTRMNLNYWNFSETNKKIYHIYLTLLQILLIELWSQLKMSDDWMELRTRCQFIAGPNALTLLLHHRTQRYSCACIQLLNEHFYFSSAFYNICRSTCSLLCFNVCMDHWMCKQSVTNLLLE